MRGTLIRLLVILSAHAIWNGVPTASAVPVIDSAQYDFATEVLTLSGRDLAPVGSLPLVIFNSVSLAVRTASTTQVTATLPNTTAAGTYMVVVLRSKGGEFAQFPVTIGAAGPQGTQGLPGAQGLSGAQGPPGSVGPVGPKGDQGVQGFSGLNGARGSQGAPGANGPIGPTGPAGMTEAFFVPPITTNAIGLGFFGTPAVIAEGTLPAGNWLIVSLGLFARANLGGAPVCVLQDSAGNMLEEADNISVGGTSVRVHLVGFASFGVPTTVTLSCSSALGGEAFGAFMAVRINNVHVLP